MTLDPTTSQQSRKEGDAVLPSSHFFLGVAVLESYLRFILM